jgi:acyl carrier protein
MMTVHFLNPIILGFASLLLFIGCETQTDSRPALVEKSNDNSTVERVCITAAELLGVDRGQVKADTSLGDLKADELDFVELVMELEERFNITIPDDVAEEMMGTGDWQKGMKNVTMLKLARVIQEQQRHGFGDADADQSDERELK